jgi:hypothetical protein
MIDRLQLRLCRGKGHWRHASNVNIFYCSVRFFFIKIIIVILNKFEYVIIIMTIFISLTLQMFFDCLVLMLSQILFAS